MKRFKIVSQRWFAHRREHVLMKSWQKQAVLLSLLAALVIIAYWPALSCDFVNYDDPDYVSENPHVLSGLTFSNLEYACRTMDDGNWIPLTRLSFLADAAIWGRNPQGYHLTNVIFHAANVCLLYFVLRWTTGATIRSGLVAALFAVHPLHVESVAWISERKDVLSAFWLLITLLSYERYAAQPTVRRYLLVAAALAMGLLAKSMLVTLPVLMLLVDIWPLERWRGLKTTAGRYPLKSARWLLLEKVPLLLLAFADGLVTMYAQHSQSTVAGFHRLPLMQRVGNAARAYVWYLQKTCVPTDLCALYPYPPPSSREVLTAAFVLLVITGVVVSPAKRERSLLTGWFWFVISLLPVIGLLQVGRQAQADRYAYIPHVGLLVLTVWGAAHICQRFEWSRWLGTGLAVAAMASGFLLTQRQIETWRNNTVLWQHVLRLYPEDFYTQYMVGLAWASLGRYGEAEPHLQNALDWQPDFVPAIVAFGNVHLAQKNWDQAEEYFRWASRLDPDNEPARRGLRALSEKNLSKVANAPTKRKPLDSAQAELKLGNAAARQGRMTVALRHFEQAVAFDPEYGEAHNNAGLALIELQRLDEAERRCHRALEVEPENGDFHVNLGSLLAMQERWQEAAVHFARALAINPRDAEAQLRLKQIRERLERK